MLRGLTRLALRFNNLDCKGGIIHLNDECVNGGVLCEFSWLMFKYLFLMRA